MCVIALVDSGVFQDFAFRADIAVLLRHVGELVDAIEISWLPVRIFFHPHVTCDAAVVEPLQQFAVALGGVGGQSLGQIAVTFAIAFDHVSRRYALLSSPCRRSLYSHDDATGVIHQIIVVIAESCRTALGSRRSSRDP
jgi:hypothetical protein